MKVVRREFWKNVLPSMIAFAFTGVYAIVDGFYVGRNVGDAGLAAINMAYPLVALIQAAGSGLGMAGAIQIAINKGKKDKQEERRYLGNAIILLAVAGIVLMAGLSLAHIRILEMFGATGEILSYAGIYIKIIAAGAMLQVFSTGMVPLIRNYDGAMTAMCAMVAGFVTNIIFDWYFVSIKGYGIAGAAAATLIGQMVTVVPCMVYLIVKVRLMRYAIFKPAANTIKYLALIAISPFGLTLSPNIVIIIINKSAIAYGGELAVSCYAVVSYVICVAQLLMQGIGDGAQPLIGRYYGSSNKEEMLHVRRMAYRFGGGVMLGCVILLYLTRFRIAGVFGVSESVEKLYGTVILYFAAGLIFAAFLRVTTSYFYAVEQNLEAYVLIYGEPLLLSLCMAFLFPKIWGLAGVWTAPAFTQCCLALVGLILLKMLDKRMLGKVK